jgi:hypothetical protein
MTAGDNEVSFYVYEQPISKDAELTRYTLLVHESGSVQPIDVMKLEAYAAELEPIKVCDCSSLRTKARMLQGAIRATVHRGEYEASELVRRLYMMLEVSEGQPVC